ncbi:preprotein translocase subunit YajC [Acetitomaculum ruminis DSM 5522]|uniref:Preprotein translocase subunit YajC n=1 Tax=Acetitomaculum ruminis DSM 5522 TaxID=1120918 RepID=A0A1I0VKX7_9FIRM|nr:preprotein translocase subunit YajC [Acetitomaculum ruminis]SFA77119.1 preprotein translocase subunit YajC [Acetitomaculum ruminis DSM 5522]
MALANILATSGTGSSTMSNLFVVGWLAILFVFMYFVIFRPQQKDAKRKKAMLADLEVGDTILTTSGFYGVCIDISDDTIIVEFGNNKNCRIPMQKAAIVEVEKVADATGTEKNDKVEIKKK